MKSDMLERSRGGEAFERVRDHLGSSVRREHCNIYDLAPERVGLFDFVYVGSVLLHLRDPIRALEAVRTVCHPNTTLIAADAIDYETSLVFPKRPLALLEGLARPWWWKPNVAGVERLYVSAGFTLTAKPKRVFLKPGRGQPTSWPRPRALASFVGREALITHLRGDPHVVVIARP
jgi:tRNA (mo5U34)-methyltransferase